MDLRNRVADLYKFWQDICNEVATINSERESMIKEIEYLF